MKYEIIKTGSRGNCIIVEDIFMLDCGVPYKMIKDKLKDIKLIFISHIHSDHLNRATVKKIAYEHPNIKFIAGEPLLMPLTECGISTKNLIVLYTDVWFNLKLCTIKLDYLYHDVPNFCLHLEYKNKKLFYCTDTSRIDHVSAKSYDLYLIEANYLTDEELEGKIIEAEHNGEFTYLKRVKETHLSQLQALNWLDDNKGENSRYIFIHEHQDRGDVDGITER